jgi:hypothetical protein
MAMANTLAYYDMATIMDVKSFVIKASDANPVKRLWSKFTVPFYKLSHLTILDTYGLAYKSVLTAQFLSRILSPYLCFIFSPTLRPLYL